MIDNARTGQNISAHRQRLGWTQGELARRLNVTHQAVSKWENGVAFPDISTLYELSRLFGVSMEQLLTGEYTSPDITQNDSPLTGDASCAAPPIAVQLPLTDESEAVSEDPYEKSPASDEENTTPTEAVHSGDAPSYDWDEIIALAPFASRNALDHLVSQCETACDREHIHALAPFISRDTLDRLIRASSDKAAWDEIISLAPFASR